MTSWTGDSKESSGQVVPRHGPRAQVLREKRERKKEREKGETKRERELVGAYFNSYSISDETGEILQI
jgi:hypothetical protein